MALSGEAGGEYLTIKIVGKTECPLWGTEQFDFSFAFFVFSFCVNLDFILHHKQQNGFS